jgi:putative mycofactocin binding protein MftB
MPPPVFGKAGRESMASNRRFVLSDGVQVRREVFGLLFYNYRGPRLFFLPTRTLIDSSFFNGRQTVDDLAAGIHERLGWPVSWIEERILALLARLEAKGLVHGQCVC